MPEEEIKIKITTQKAFDAFWDAEAHKIQALLERKYRCQLKYTGRLEMRNGYGFPEFRLIYTDEDLKDV